jgi:hypothetical protein
MEQSSGFLRLLISSSHRIRKHVTDPHNTDRLFSILIFVVRGRGVPRNFFKGRGGGSQLCQYFGISEGRVFENPPLPLPIGTPLVRGVYEKSTLYEMNVYIIHSSSKFIMQLVCYSLPVGSKS